MSNVPEGISAHSGDYEKDSWRGYTMDELGGWVHLLYRRAEMRTTQKKRAKDLYDARNYLSMMDAKLNELEQA